MRGADPVTREILLAFWKVHILHHAAEQPVYGQWILEELSRHGYHLSPGTLYPLLRRMEKSGWLRAVLRRAGSNHGRREYRLTVEGRRVLRLLRAQVKELHREVVEEASHEE
jgi:PadR family transcriptional regulator PadR